MRLSPRVTHVVTALLLLPWIDAALIKRSTYQCPIGFLPGGDVRICYRLKEPEAFDDKFEDCTGNLYSSKLLNSLNLRTKQVVWTEYKSLYPGGPFVDWSYTNSTGDILLTTDDVKYDSSLGIDEELCVVIDPVSNYTAARCNEKHFRYCMVKPYSDDVSDPSKKGCRDEFMRFYSPLSTCLTALMGKSGGVVRATWSQAQELCKKKGASLMYKGWRYTNSPVMNHQRYLPLYTSQGTFPVGIVMNPENRLLQYDTKEDKSMVPSPEWVLSSLWGADAGAVYGAVRESNLTLVNSSFIFFDVICEQPVALKTVSMDLELDGDNKLMLHVNDSMKERDVRCFTDSNIFSRSTSSIEVRVRKEDDQTFRVATPANGYYWCIQTAFRIYHTSESNKALYVKSEESVRNLYATKIRTSREYRFNELDKHELEELVKSWKNKLELHILNEYSYNISNYKSFSNEQDLQDFKMKLEKASEEGKIITEISIRRLYLDGRTALVHVRLDPEIKPVAAGSSEDLNVVYMKPVFYCEQVGSVPERGMTESATSAGCSTFTCTGDFNRGVQWVETAIDGCSTKEIAVQTELNVDLFHSAMPTWPPFSTRSNLYSNTDPPEPPPEPDCSSDESCETKRPHQRPTTEPSTEDTEWTFTTVNNTPEITTVEVTTAYTTYEPTTPEPTTPEPTTLRPTTPRPPQEQLDQVVGDLEGLVAGAGSGEPIGIESISHSFDQVNQILEVEDPDLVIPGQLLHLLDQLASVVELDDSHQAIAVRDNVAILMADATPDHPVRGVRVAARDYDAFSNQTFGFIDGKIDETQLLRNASEALVYLPASVSSTPRRVSFVAFRNQRAFHSSLPVNSRVFSVNVENLTRFDDGEVIDIHLTPIVEDPERNQSRVCAYWKFTSNDTGEWSTDGCTLIRATTPGAMDTCRCTHLTHFAEVLVPRTVFSDRDEAALEILSIVGGVLSLLGLALIALTAALFRTWRRDYSNKIWLQLCIAIFVMIVCFLVIVFARFDGYDVPCMLVGVALHYAVLASFCWMLVAAVLSYRRLVLVFTRDMSHKLLRASAFAWGTPCAIVGILLSVSPQSYHGQFIEKSTNAFCYPSGLGLWLAVYAPIALMLLANWTLFVLIVRSVFASRRIQRHGDSNEALRCASVSCLLVFLFGLPWIFGLFAYNVVAAYLFTLTGTFQGVVLFMFFVLGNKKTRDLWLNKLKIKQTRKVPVTSSTYTNRSTGPGWRAGPEGVASIEAKTSKPRSLTSPDDSRFS